ncbi:MAG TPA: aminotransferase [Acidimicrobiaceae bacterium]|nr:aminotransferase [Acidimicrobiaceae bacterium]HCB37957.1 aminotransferase [Acidimicrobiaceae bacterium]
MIFDLDPHRVANRPGIKWGRHGSDVLAAWVADMDLEPAPVIEQALTERIAAGGLGYDFYDKPIPVLEAFVERMATAFGWQTETAEVIRVHDVMQGFALTIDRLTSPGDGVIVSTPAYPPVFSCIERAARRVVDNPLRLTDSGWQLDLDHLDSVAAAGDVTAVFVCQPHNPTGLVLDADDLAALTEIAERHDLLMISDEIHCDLVYEPWRHLPLAASSEAASQRTVTLTAATKSFNIAALRLAFVHSASQRYAPAVLGIRPQMIGGINSLGQVATVAAWKHGQPWLDELLAGLDHNRRLLADLVAEHLPGVRYEMPQSTYLAWLDCTELGLGDDPSAVFMDKGRVFVNPGLDFGPQGAGHVRLNFATSPQMLERVVAALGSVL